MKHYQIGLIGDEYYILLPSGKEVKIDVQDGKASVTVSYHDPEVLIPEVVVFEEKRIHNNVWSYKLYEKESK